MLLHNTDTLKNEIPNHMSQKRFVHTLGVYSMAQTFAPVYGINTNDAQTAALLHDIAKERPIDEQRMMLEKYFIDEILWEEWDIPAIWHSHVGAIIAEETFWVIDTSILNAIRWHTTGDPSMDDLSKLIWLCDVAEPGRKENDIVTYIRTELENKTSLDTIMAEALPKSFEIIENRGEIISPRSKMLLDKLQADIT